MNIRWLLLLLGILSSSSGCSHESAAARREHAATYSVSEENIRTRCNSASARISVLIANGQFAEAKALIAEGVASGLISRPQATRLLERIAQLGTKLGEIPAKLQRAPDFPSQLRDYTLFQIKQMLERRDFSIATEPQLRMAKKLIENPDRLMEKVR